MDVPVYIVFDDEGCGRTAREKSSQCVEMTKPCQSRASSDRRCVFCVETGYIIWRPDRLCRDGNIDLGNVRGGE